MEIEQNRSNKEKRAAIAAGVVALACVALVGCSDAGGINTPAHKLGELGNGAFLFACDDSVACDRWSTGSANNFPAEIASGSNFGIFFVEKGRSVTATEESFLQMNRQGTTVTVDDRRYEGVTSQPIGPNLSSGPSGFSAVHPGFATIVARDHTGTVIDYTTVTIVQPDSLIIYKSDYKGDNPTPVDSIPMRVGYGESYRVVTARSGMTIAGSVRVDWSSDDPTIADVGSYTRGVVQILAHREGKTILRGEGAALKKAIVVEVTP